MIDSRLHTLYSIYWLLHVLVLTLSWLLLLLLLLLPRHLHLSLYCVSRSFGGKVGSSQEPGERQS